MQQDKISIDLKLPTRWEDLSDKQLWYVFVLLAQGYTATEVKAYYLCRRAGLKVLHRYGNNGWACRHGKQEFRSSRNAAQVERRGGACSHLCRGAAGVAVTPPRGNNGDIGRTNRGSSESRGELARTMPSRDRGRRSQRLQRRWFSRKYYASVMNIKEFYEDNIGRSFTGILCSALSKDFGRNH